MSNKKERGIRMKEQSKRLLLVRFILVLVMLVSLFGCKIKPKDPISNNSWKASDGSFIVFQDNGEFYWYRDVNVKDDYYYYGNYKIYQGEEAIEFLDGITKFGLSKEEQEDYIARLNAVGIKVSDYYCIELVNESLITNHEEQIIESWKTYYVGFYIEKENTLDMVGLDSSTTITFVLYK